MPEILHVTPLAFGSHGAWGGGERFAHELARAQAGERPTRLLAFGETEAHYHDGDLEVVIAPRRGCYGNAMNPISERLISMILDARVVHIHQWNSLLTSVAVFSAALARRDVFVTDHGGDGPNPLRRLKPARRVNALLAVSQYSAALLPEFGLRSRVIYCGVDTARFRPPERSQAREQSVVFVGRLQPQKGVDVLVEAMPPDVPLHIYGRVLDEEFRRRLLLLSRDKTVHLHEHASDDEIRDAYQRSRVAVLPSIYRTPTGAIARKSELFGITLAEAMACGTPAICSAVGGMPEVVLDGQTGSVVPDDDPQALRDAICEVLAMPAGRWREMSVAASEHVRANFTWSQCGGRSLAAYDELSSRSDRS